MLREPTDAIAEAVHKLGKFPGHHAEALCCTEEEETDDLVMQMPMRSDEDPERLQLGCIASLCQASGARGRSCRQASFRWSPFVSSARRHSKCLRPCSQNNVVSMPLIMASQRWSCGLIPWWREWPRQVLPSQLQRLLHGLQVDVQTAEGAALFCS